MPLSFQCPCGRPLQAEPKQLGSAVRCPGCGRVLRLPALGRLEPSPRVPPRRQAAPAAPRRWRRLWPVPVVALLVLADTGLVLFRSFPRPPQGAAAPAPAAAAEMRVPDPVVARTASPAEAPAARAKDPAQYREPPPSATRAELPPASEPSAARRSVPEPPPAPTPAREPAPPPAAGRLAHLRQGDRFYQEVVVGRVSACQAPGLEFRDQARFAYLSSLHVDRVTAEGAVVTQKVEAVRLDQAEAAQRAELGALLRKARGVSFRIHLGPDGEVTRVEGAPNGAGALSGLASPEGLSLSLQSALDPDAWKELAQLTFFRPRGSPGGDGRWSRELAHDWGPLGRWSGQVSYRPGRKAAGLDRYDYVLDLAYRPPEKGAGGLLVTVDKADFRLVAGGGSIAYDVSRGRVTAAEERFQVRGLLAATALGMTTAVAVEEAQVFQLRMLDRMPDPESWSASR